MQLIATVVILWASWALQQRTISCYITAIVKNTRKSRNEPMFLILEEPEYLEKGKKHNSFWGEKSLVPKLL